MQGIQKTSFTYGTVCSGVEGFGYGLDLAGGECLFQVEIDAKCRQVLTAHYPDAKRHTDMTTVGGHNLDSVDVFCGGTPCQSYSIAGLRGGMSDARGNLAFEFCRICDELEPRVIIWENVPGVLSSADNAFGCFLAGLSGADAPLLVPAAAGGRWTDAGVVSGPRRTVAWRILDAQFFGTPQRRRRVFVVASPDAECAVEILFERTRLFGHSETGGETGQGAPTETGIGFAGDGGLFDFGTGGDGGSGIDGDSGAGRDGDTCYDMTHAADVIREVPGGIVPTLQARMGTGGNQVPLVATRTREDSPLEDSPMPSVSVEHRNASCAVTEQGDKTAALRAGAEHSNQFVLMDEVCPTVTSKWAKGSGGPAGDECQNEILALVSQIEAGQEAVLAFQPRYFTRDNATGSADSCSSDVVPPLTSRSGLGDSTTHVVSSMVIRRLMPIECERLQGFEDGWTEFGVTESPAGMTFTPAEWDVWVAAHTVPMSDSTRYKMMGNAVNCAVSTWLGQRLAPVISAMKECI